MILAVSFGPARARTAVADQVCNGTAVSTLVQLQNIAQAPNITYCLTKDIDAGATSGWNGGAGFLPIADFNGILDGQGHAVKNLTIAQTAGANTGLIADLEGGIIRNLGLTTPQIYGPEDVGAFAGHNNAGIVSGDHVNGGYVASTGGNDQAAGGLIGSDSGGSVSDDYSSSSVSGSFATYVGGLIGISNGNVTRVYNTGPVSGDIGSTTGGLIGENRGTLSNAYNQGTVTGYQGVTGGLVGFNSGTMDYSYAAAAVNWDLFGGALIGENDAKTVVSDFWDSTTDPTDGAIGQNNALLLNGEVAGYPDDQMKQLLNFVEYGWDFSNTWGVVNGTTYPFLISLASTRLVVRGDYCLPAGTSCAQGTPSTGPGWTFAHVEADTLPQSTSLLPRLVHLECRSVYSSGGLLYQNVGIVDTSSIYATLSGKLFIHGSLGGLTLSASSTLGIVPGLPDPPAAFTDSGKASGFGIILSTGNHGTGRLTAGSFRVSIQGDIVNYVWDGSAWEYNTTQPGKISCIAGPALNTLLDNHLSQHIPVPDAAIVHV